MCARCFRLRVLASRTAPRRRRRRGVWLLPCGSAVLCPSVLLSSSPLFISRSCLSTVSVSYRRDETRRPIAREPESESSRVRLTERSARRAAHNAIFVRARDTFQLCHPLLSPRLGSARLPSPMLPMRALCSVAIATPPPPQHLHFVPALGSARLAAAGTRLSVNVDVDAMSLYATALRAT